MVTVMITEHPRNGIIIGDFQKDGNSISAIKAWPNRIVFWCDKWNTCDIWAKTSTDNPIIDLLITICKYMDDDVQADIGDKIIFVRKENVS